MYKMKNLFQYLGLALLIAIFREIKIPISFSGPQNTTTVRVFLNASSWFLSTSSKNIEDVFLIKFSHLQFSCWQSICKSQVSCTKMYCLQWLLPLLLIPKPANPFLLQNHSMFMTLYLASFFLERRPCTICTIVFVAAVALICYSGLGNCFFFVECNDT